MKIQDILFFVILALLIYKKDSKWTAVVGLLSLALSIPLFATWTFFTAEHLTWYAAAFFLISTIQYIKLVK